MSGSETTIKQPNSIYYNGKRYRVTNDDGDYITYYWMGLKTSTPIEFWTKKRAERFRDETSYKRID